jgi:hypothetical protein
MKVSLKSIIKPTIRGGKNIKIIYLILLFKKIGGGDIRHY